MRTHGRGGRVPAAQAAGCGCGAVIFCMRWWLWDCALRGCADLPTAVPSPLRWPGSGRPRVARSRPARPEGAACARTDAEAA